MMFGLFNRAIPKLEDRERTKELAALKRKGAPLRIVIDPGLKPGDYYIVRGFASKQEEAIHQSASGLRAWADTVQL